MRLALVVLEHAGCPCFKIYWCAFRGLKESIMILEKVSAEWDEIDE